MSRTSLFTAAMLTLSLAACHRHDAEHGHDHGPGGVHERAEIPAIAATHFGGRTELFLEYPTLVRGETSRFAAHLNDLEKFKPLAAGKVVVRLSGGGSPDEVFEVTAPSVPGIFRPEVKPAHAGPRQLVVTVEGPAGTDVHDLGITPVHASVAEAMKMKEPVEPAGLVPFLKEQQWRTDFATAAAEEAQLRPSFVANGVLAPRAGGEARVIAPVAGRLIAPGGAVPALGKAVRRDEVLAVLATRLEGSDPAALELERTQARNEVEHARREVERVEGLAAAGAIPKKRVHDAARALADADARLRAAERRVGQWEGTQLTGASGAASRVSLRSPIAGVVARADAAPGAFVAEGRELFHIVDLDRLSLQIRIPEAEVARAATARGAWFDVEGFDRPFDGTPESGARVVALGAAVDPETRTVPLVIELPNPGRKLRAGLAVRARVLSGESIRAVTVPASAVVDEGAEHVVFVEVSGERFERRVVQTGVRDRDLVQITSGLGAGERVVTRGAWQVRLAGASGAIPAHGHVH
jgi:cobalt-zinc-cadmium efflux system membrane fusion protein